MVLTTKHYTTCLLMIMLLFERAAIAIDNPHFYRANFFWQEPRIARNWLSSLYLTIGTGSATTSRTDNNNSTSLLNILGPHNLKDLGTNVPGLDPLNPLDAILIDLANLPNPNENDFGKIQFMGKFRTTEFVMNAYQNLTHGFFIQAYLPVRNFKFHNLRQFKDLSPDTNQITPNRMTPEWQNFLDHFGDILERYQLNIPDCTNQTGIGDFTLLGGWTWSNQDTTVIDYIDLSARIGYLFSTATTKNESDVFGLSFGYNGFTGVPVKFDGALGLCDWFTAGVHVGALFFHDRTKDLHLKTAEAQNGFIKLAHGPVEVEQGTIWETALYTKADHVVRGWSLLFGYTYTKKDRDCLHPLHDDFNTHIINSDTAYHSWRAHVLHFIAGYDFATDVRDCMPEIYFYYNLVVGGERIFNTAMEGLDFGIHVAWCY